MEYVNKATSYLLACTAPQLLGVVVIFYIITCKRIFHCI